MMGKGCYLKHLLAKRFLSFMHLEPQLRGVTSRKKREYNSPEGVDCGIILNFPFLSLIIILIKITVFHEKTCFLECGTVFNKHTFYYFPSSTLILLLVSVSNIFTSEGNLCFTLYRKTVLSINFSKTGVLDLPKVDKTQSSQSDYFLGQWRWCIWWIPLYCLSFLLLHSVNVQPSWAPTTMFYFSTDEQSQERVCHPISSTSGWNGRFNGN